jgi:hypothetical protein
MTGQSSPFLGLMLLLPSVFHMILIICKVDCVLFLLKMLQSKLLDKKHSFVVLGCVQLWDQVEELILYEQLDMKVYVSTDYTFHGPLVYFLSTSTF